MRRPADTEYAPFFETYVSKVPETDVLPVLEAQPQHLRDLAARIPADRETFRYEPGKWSIREVLGHIIDAERVFGYRALCFSRGEQQTLTGFDEEAYTAASDFHTQPVADLAGEFAVVRESNLIMLRRFTAANWDRTGAAAGRPMSVRALAYVMAGHPRHHFQLLAERYGVPSIE